MHPRVLFAVRATLDAQPGGDSVQVHRTAEALRMLGAEVEVTADPDAPMDEFDVVHLWHLERAHETYLHFLRARRAARPLVLSTIYWPWGSRPRRVQPGPHGRLLWATEDLKNLCRYVRARSPIERRTVAAALRAGWANCRHALLRGADLLLPNSQAEAEILSAEAPGVRCRVVPNAVDVDRARRIAAEADAERDGVLCVGHFDRRKNQLGAIRALRETDIPVTFVGAARGFHRRYYRACRAAAGRNMTFLPPMEHDEVLRRLASSKVHLCPSHFETPGLVNLEAGIVGCALALGESPPVREYFRRLAEYFRPTDERALREAVRRALNGPPGALADHVAENYSWRRTAERTLEAYRMVLEEPGR